MMGKIELNGQLQKLNSAGHKLDFSILGEGVSGINYALWLHEAKTFVTDSCSQ